MSTEKTLSRRGFIVLAGVAGAGVMAGCSGSKEIQGDSSTAIEYLARHHGVLHRAVAIMEEVRGAMEARMDLPPDIIGGTVDIVRRFIIGYHQQAEEKYIYSIFDKANKMTGLVGVLREQHAAGSQLMEVLKGLSAGFSAKDLEKRRTMGSAIHQSRRMFRAHAEREDTVLLPALRRIIPSKAYVELSAQFEKAEREVLGQNGFDEIIQKLTDYENVLGIGDLASFTPRVDELS